MLWTDEDVEAEGGVESLTPRQLASLELGQTIFGLRGKIWRKPPPVLWHYTSGQALIEIISHGELWATQVSCLNDQAELLHAAQLLRNAFATIREESDSSLDHQFLDMVCEELGADLSLQSDVFVVSFSEHEDDLNQWRNYGGGEGGYAIGFNQQGLDFGQIHGQLTLPVVYDPVMQTELMRSVAEAVLLHYRTDVAANEVPRETSRNIGLRSALDSLTVIGPFLKSEAFHSEAEWRVVWRRTPRDSLRFRQKQSLLARHLPLDFHRAGEIPATGKLPLSFIGVGPCRHQAVSIHSVLALLESKGYPTRKDRYEYLKEDGFRPDLDPPRVVVWSSDVPFRGN